MATGPENRSDERARVAPHGAGGSVEYGAACESPDAEPTRETHVKPLDVRPDGHGRMGLLDAATTPVACDGTHEARDLVHSSDNPRRLGVLRPGDRKASEDVREAFGVVDGLLKCGGIEGAKGRHVFLGPLFVGATRRKLLEIRRVRGVLPGSG